MTTVQYAADRAGDSKAVGWAGRLGLIAMGVSYGLVAVLAILLATGHGGKTTDRQGALQTLAHDGLGRLVVVVLAVGFAGYAVWRFAQAFLDRGEEGTDAKGLATSTVRRRHILRNALLPVSTTIGLQTGLLLSGAVLTETVFAFGGVGLELRQAIGNRDYAVLQGFILLLAIMYVVVNLLVDISYSVLNPRIRIGGAAASA